MDRDFYRLCNYVDALAQLPTTSPLGWSKQIFEQARVLLRSAPRCPRVAPSPSEVNCLATWQMTAHYDCETEIQDLGLVADPAIGNGGDSDRLSIVRSAEKGPAEHSDKPVTG